MSVKKISSETGNAALDLALVTIKIGKQALVFNNTKRSAEKTAEDIAKAVLFLASPLADYITGASIDVNGGDLME